MIIPLDENPPQAKISKYEIDSELMKRRVMPKRGAAAKSPLSYAENHEIDSDESLELPTLPSVQVAANSGLANTGQNEETNTGKFV